MSIFLSLLCCASLASLLLSPPVFAQPSSLPRSESDSQEVELRQRATQADLIAMGYVVKTDSFWSLDGTRIESKTTLKLARQLKGYAPQYVEVHTMGGFVEEENLGMMEVHEASFSVGEDVLIFATVHDDGYRLVGGAAGKYHISGANVLNYSDASRGSLKYLLSNLESMLGAQHPTVARDRLAQPSPRRGLSDIFQQHFVTSSHRKWSAIDGKVPFFVNLNTSQAGYNDGTRAEFLYAIRSAAATWNNVTAANFTLQYSGSTQAEQASYNGYNEVLFMNKGLGERGAVAHIWYRRDLTVVEADIWINDDYDWNADGPLEVHELDLESVLLHEFGHWFVLGHLADESTVMYRTLSGGTMKRMLHPADEQGIAAIYPCKTKRC